MSKEIASLEQWEKQLGVVADDVADQEAKTGQSQYISIRGGTFSLGNYSLGEEIDVIIAGSAWEKAYYDRPYDPNNVTPPACFAVAGDSNLLTPHATAPNKQSDSCDKCPLNEFGSAAVGKGKACRDSRRLGLYAYDQSGFDKSQLVVLRVPPTSLKNISRYIKALARDESIRRPVWSVVTRLTFDKTADWPVLVPIFSSKVEKLDELQWLQDNQSSILEAISEPYDVTGWEPIKRRSKAS